MASDKLTEAFEKNQPSGEKKETGQSRSESIYEKSLAIVQAIEKLLAKGDQITDKARLDYNLARSYIADYKQKKLAPALRAARELVDLVEAARETGEALPENISKHYPLFKKFLETYDPLFRKKK